jgi:hypothetical protein
LLAKKLVIITPFVLLVSSPCLAQPLLVVLARLDVFAVASAIMPEVVVIAQKDCVWASIRGPRAQNLRLVWEFGEDILLLLGGQDVPGLRVEQNRLGVVSVNWA